VGRIFGDGRNAGLVTDFGVGFRAGFRAGFGSWLFFGVAQDVGAGFSRDLGIGGGDRVEAGELGETRKGVDAGLLDEMLGAERVEIFQEREDGEDVWILHPIGEFGNSEMATGDRVGQMDVAVEKGAEHIGLIERERGDGWGRADWDGLLSGLVERGREVRGDGFEVGRCRVVVHANSLPEKRLVCMGSGRFCLKLL